MRYYISVTTYIGKNKAQKELAEFVTHYHGLLLDYNKEREAFIEHIMFSAAYINKTHPRCKDVELIQTRNQDDWVYHLMVDGVFTIVFHPINEKRYPKLFHAKETYRRVDYLVRQAKADGFDLDKRHCERTFLVPPNQFAKVTESKAIRELMQVHNYGVQAAITD